jgi:hypothetical protein
LIFLHTPFLTIAVDLSAERISYFIRSFAYFDIFLARTQVSYIMSHGYDRKFCFYLCQAPQVYPSEELVAFDVAETGLHIMTSTLHPFPVFGYPELFPERRPVTFQVFIYNDLPVCSPFPLPRTALPKERTARIVFTCIRMMDGKETCFVSHFPDFFETNVPVIGAQEAVVCCIVRHVVPMKNIFFEPLCLLLVVRGVFEQDSRILPSTVTMQKSGISPLDFCLSLFR